MICWALFNASALIRPAGVESNISSSMRLRLNASVLWTNLSNISSNRLSIALLLSRKLLTFLIQPNEVLPTKRLKWEWVVDWQSLSTNVHDAIPVRNNLNLTCRMRRDFAPPTSKTVSFSRERTSAGENVTRETNIRKKESSVSHSEW